MMKPVFDKYILWGRLVHLWWSLYLISIYYRAGWFIYALFHNRCKKQCLGFYGDGHMILWLLSTQIDGILWHLSVYLNDSLFVHEMNVCRIVYKIFLLIFQCMGVLLNITERDSSWINSSLISSFINDTISSIIYLIKDIISWKFSI